MFKKKIYLEILENGKELPLIDYAKEGDAGMDLRAAIPENSRLVIPPGSWELIPCGFRLALPKGYEAQVRSRSGMALKQGLFVLNSPGTVDEGYRGEVGVILANFGKFEQSIHRGDRVAQMVISKVTRGIIVPINKLSITKRGEGGFGSSGRN